jgi:hypothetical protein
MEGRLAQAFRINNLLLELEAWRSGLTADQSVPHPLRLLIHAGESFQISRLGYEPLARGNL